MLKIKANDSVLLRFGKQLLQGSLIGAVIGSPLGIIIAYFGLEEGLSLPMDRIMSYLSYVFYGIIVLSMVAAVTYIFAIRKHLLTYEGTEDDEQVEEVYRLLGRQIGYAQIFSGISLILAIVNMVLTYKIDFTSDSATVFSLYFPWMASLLVSTVLQMYLLALNNRMRGTKTTLLPTFKELKNNVLQLDEAELQANYKMAFDIVLTLSSIILPSIYILLCVIAMLFQRIELTALLITAGIHLYIMVMSFKMTKDYFK